MLKEADHTSAIRAVWHTDHSYDLAPAICSILHAIDVPSYGGDTCFTSMYAAYGGLSALIKTSINGLSAEYPSRHVFGKAKACYVVHPMVIKHPLSGRLAPYVNPQFTTKILGLSEI